MTSPPTTPPRPLVERAHEALGVAAGAVRAAFVAAPPVTSAERALSRAVTAVATLIAALAAGYGLWAPIQSGHDAAIASMGIIAENMLRWQIAAPVWLPADVAPDRKSVV